MVNLIVYNACEAMKLLIITWIHTCISFNKLIWLIQKNDKIDILSLLFMPFTGNKSPGAKKGSDEWWWDNFTNIFWVKRTFTYLAFIPCILSSESCLIFDTSIQSSILSEIRNNSRTMVHKRHTKSVQKTSVCILTLGVI